MHDQRRDLFRLSNKDSHTSSSEDHNNRQERGDGSQEKKEQSDHYYYAYGPYQSVKREEAWRTTTSVDTSGHMNDVKVTPPSPVKPLPFSSVTQQESVPVNYSSSIGQEDGTGQSVPPQGGWNFKKITCKSGTSFKVMFATFMVGALVTFALMIMADKMDIFTSNSSNIVHASVNTSRTPFPNGANSVVDVVKKVSPAVVKIETFGSVGRGSRNPWEDDWFRQFLGEGIGNSHSRQDAKPKLQSLGAGTGFIFEKDGYILTNQHVIEDGELIQVTVEGKAEPIKAELLGHNKDLDLAVLKIKAGGDLPAVSFGNSDTSEIGESLIAIGNPSGFDHTVTVGVLSAREREIYVEGNGGVRKYQHLLQTDASINPGNSGGPLLNIKGEVIGMNVAVSRQSQGIGFAIPSNMMSKVIEDLKNKRDIPKEPVPFIGVGLATMTDDIASNMGTDLIKGSLVLKVEYGSPAYEADLRAYDIITGIDGTKYTTRELLTEQIRKKKVGDTVPLQIVRNGKAIDVRVKVGDYNKFAKQSD